MSKRKMRRGQAALEYLMSYGFALVIIAVVVGVLIYMGILAPPSVGVCTGFDKLAYEDHTMDYNGYFSLYLRNGTGYRLTGLSAEFKGDFTGSASVNADSVLEGNYFKVSGPTTKSADDTYTGKITVGYKRGRYGTHYETITCTGKADRKTTGPTLFEVDASTVALWHFNEDSGNNIYDETSNHNDGIIYGATRVNGRFSRGLSFDGINDYVEVPHNSVLNPVDVTIEAWAKRNTDGIGRIVEKDGAYVGGYDILVLYSQGILLGASPEHLSASFGHGLWGNIWGDEYYDHDEEDPDEMPENTWQYVAVTFDERSTGSPVKLYRNGSLVADGNSNGYVYYSKHSGPLHIGSTSNTFNGLIDEVRISNKARTSAEIEAMWQKAQGLMPP